MLNHIPSKLCVHASISNSTTQQTKREHKTF